LYSEGVVDALPTREVIVGAILYAVPGAVEVVATDGGLEVAATAIGTRLEIAERVLERSDVIQDILEDTLVDHSISPQTAMKVLAVIEPELRDVIHDAIDPVSKSISDNKIKALRDVTVWAATEIARHLPHIP
jgi:hypothetical protein